MDMDKLRNDPGIVKYRDLARILRDRIASETYKAGERIPTEPELEQEFKVSKITVRNAVNLLVNDGLVKKRRGKGNGTTVLQKSERLPRIRKGSSFGVFAERRGLSSRETAVPDLLASLCGELNHWDAHIGLFPFVHGIDQAAYLKSVIERNVIDGLFLLPMAEYTAGIVSHLRRIGFPFVCIRPCDGEDGLEFGADCPCVLIDELAPFECLLDRAEARGIESVTMLGIDAVDSQRTWGLIRRTRLAKGLHVERALIDLDADIRAPLRDLLQSRRANGRSLLVISSQELLPYFDCVAADLNLKIPADLAVVLHRHYDTLSPRLSQEYDSIDRPFAEVGKAACSLLYEAIAMKQQGKPMPHDRRVSLQGVYTDRGTVLPRADGDDGANRNDRNGRSEP